MKALCIALFGALVIALFHAPAFSAEGHVSVATRVVPPLVVEEDGQLTGFSIELWNGIADRLKLKTNYTVTPDVKALLETVASDKAELGIAAISITAERDRLFDFSLPILDSGLQILLRGAADGDSNPLEGFLRLLFSPTLLVWLGIAAVLIIVPAHVVWFLERRHNEGIVPRVGYFPGIFPRHVVGGQHACDPSRTDAAPLARPRSRAALDVRRRGVRRLLHRPTHSPIDGAGNPRLDHRP